MATGKYARLKEDFLGRDEGFIHQRKTGRLGWEATLPENTSLAEYIFSLQGKETLEVVKEAWGIAMTLVKAMDLPKKVKVVLTTKDVNYTDFEKVAVSTSVFDVESLPLGQRLGVFLGEVIHECCHNIWTSSDTSLYKGKPKVIHYLANIVEDERIELLLGEKYPGYVNFIKLTKYYFFGMTREGVDPDTVEDEGARIVNAILALVRYPAALTEKAINEFGDELLEVLDILESGWPNDKTETVAVAEKIYEVIKNHFTKPKSKKGSGGGSGEDGEPSEGGDNGDNESSENEDRDSENRSGEDDDSEENDDKESSKSGESKKSDKGKDGTSKPSSDNDGESGSDKDDESDSSETNGEHSDSSDSCDSGEPMTEEEFNEKIGKAIEQILKEYAEKDGSLKNDCDEAESVRRLSEKFDDKVQEYLEDSCELGANPSLIVLTDPFFSVDMVTAEIRYQNALDRVRRYIPAVRSVLKDNSVNYKYQTKGELNGKLDTGKLAEAYQGAKGVYLGQAEVKSDDIAVAILVDESGSMYDERIAVARDAAVLLSEALKGISSIETFIYGHTADLYDNGDMELVVYQEGRRKMHKAALGAIDAMDDNADGYAIEEVARRVRRLTSRKCLLFVISDGQPAACVYRRASDGVIHTASVVKDIQKKDIIPVQINIGDSDFGAERMFSHVVRINQLHELPKQLSVMVKNAILKNAVRKRS